MKSLLFIFLFAGFSTFAQGDLPIQVYKGTDAAKPLLFYISGDGGLNNSFSGELVKKLTAMGYPLIGLDARTYFWKRKSPQQAADDISKTLTVYMEKWNCKSLVLIGYSFGADVMPFIQRRLPGNVAAATQHIILMSPSAKTDFEIHILGLLGFDNSSGENVPKEINRLTKPVTVLFGEAENPFPLQSLTAKNIRIITLPGHHHYDNNADAVVKQLVESIR